MACPPHMFSEDYAKYLKSLSPEDRKDLLKKNEDGLQEMYLQAYREKMGSNKVHPWRPRRTAWTVANSPDDDLARFQSELRSDDDDSWAIVPRQTPADETFHELYDARPPPGYSNQDRRCVEFKPSENYFGYCDENDSSSDDIVIIIDYSSDSSDDDWGTNF